MSGAHERNWRRADSYLVGHECYLQSWTQTTEVNVMLTRQRHVGSTAKFLGSISFCCSVPTWVMAQHECVSVICTRAVGPVASLEKLPQQECQQKKIPTRRCLHPSFCQVKSTKTLHTESHVGQSPLLDHKA